MGRKSRRRGGMFKTITNAFTGTSTSASVEASTQASTQASPSIDLSSINSKLDDLIVEVDKKKNALPEGNAHKQTLNTASTSLTAIKSTLSGVKGGSRKRRKSIRRKKRFV